MLQSCLKLPCILDCDSSIREWLNDPRGKVVMEPVFQELSRQMVAVMAAGEDASQTIGMNMMDFMVDMPLFMMLSLIGDMQLRPGEEIVNNLLAQVHGQKR